MYRHLKADADFFIIGVIDFPEVPAEISHTAPVSVKQLDQYFLGSGFPGPGWAQKPEDLTFMHVKCDAFDGIFTRGRIPEVQVSDTENSSHGLTPFF